MPRRTISDRIRGLAAVVIALLVVPQTALYAGGPLIVGGSSFGIEGQPFTWDTSGPVQYRVDGGPLSRRSNGTVVIDNTAGVTRVQNMFGPWQAVQTANIRFSNSGSLLAVGTFTGGDVQTPQQFLDLLGDFDAPDPVSCNGGGQSPIIFDADGNIFDGLGFPAGVIGFAFPCALDPVTGRIVSAGAALNGRFQDGVDSGSNFELTTAEFDQAFTHEFGHFSGLDHSQINLNVINGQPLACNLEDNTGLPLMFPALFCQARTSVGLPILSVDDAAWISRLYPVGSSPPAGKRSFTSAYGTITGTLFFSDGVTPAQGVNVIARQVDNPGTTQNESKRNAVSVVSGYLFAGNPGQSVTCTDPSNPAPGTCTNLGGSSFGSRDPRKAGSFDIPVPPGNYTLEVESVFAGFQGGSSVGPLDPPIPAPGTAAKSSPISVTAGATVIHDMVLQGTPPRFDAFESAQAVSREPALVAYLRREDSFRETRQA